MKESKLLNYNFNIILFDLGGVLIELDIHRMEGFMNFLNTKEDFWQRWLASPIVNKFEVGKLTPSEFASGIINEFNLKVDPQYFIQEFASWIKGTYPGTIELLKKLSCSYKLGVLSNTNEIHWQRISNDLGIANFFDYKFPSYRTCLLKPNKKAFQFAIDNLHSTPNQILFFDDVQHNVDVANSFGILAYKVLGPDQVKLRLKDLERYTLLLNRTNKC